MTIRRKLINWLLRTEKPIKGPLPRGLDSMGVEPPRSVTTGRGHSGIAVAGDLDGEIR